MDESGQVRERRDGGEQAAGWQAEEGRGAAGTAKAGLGSEEGEAGRRMAEEGWRAAAAEGTAGGRRGGEGQSRQQGGRQAEAGSGEGDGGW